MAGPFRIRRALVIKEVSATSKIDAQFRAYFERLIKMIPAEVIGLYMAGSGIIPAEPSWMLIAFSAFCLICVFVVRIWGTADPEKNLPPQGVPVLIAAGAFVIWLYHIGGPFVSLGIHVPWIGSILIVCWSFIIPIFYRGD